MSDSIDPGETLRRNSAFGQIAERPPYVQRNPDGSVTYRRVPRTSAEAIEMVYEDRATGARWE